MNLPREWRKMTEAQKDAFINYGASLADRQRELERRGFYWLS